MSNQQPSDNTVWERLIGLILACAVVIAFIYFIFNSPQINTTIIAVIRFLAAFVAAIAAYLFVGSLGLEGQLPLINVKVKAVGSFATFIVVFFLFLYGIPSEPNSPLNPTPNPTDSFSPNPRPKPTPPKPLSLIGDHHLIELGILVRNIASVGAPNWNDLRKVSSPIVWETDFREMFSEPVDDKYNHFRWLGSVFLRVNGSLDLDATGRKPALWNVSAYGSRPMVSYVSLSRQQSIGMSIQEFETRIFKSITDTHQSVVGKCEGKNEFDERKVSFLMSFSDSDVPITLSYSCGAGGCWATFIINSMEDLLPCSKS